MRHSRGKHGRISAVAFAIALLSASACDQDPKGWVPVLEETSTTVLRTETEKVEDRVQAAKATLSSDPETASAALEDAQESLQNLLSYYLPMLEARQRAYNAYQRFQLGEESQTLDELGKIEALLLRVARSDEKRLLHAMEEPLEEIEDARAAIKVESGDALGILEALATRLNQLLVKGGLVLSAQR